MLHGVQLLFAEGTAVQSSIALSAMQPSAEPTVLVVFISLPSPLLQLTVEQGQGTVAKCSLTHVSMEVVCDVELFVCRGQTV